MNSSVIKPVIKRIQAKVVRLPLEVPVAIATRVVTERFWLFVKVTTADGVDGLGFSYVGYDNGPIAETIIDLFLKPIVLEKDATNTAMLWADMTKACQFFGTDGLIMRCISAIDIALWDRNAKAREIPLFQIFNAQNARLLPVYVGAGYYPTGGSSAAAENRALAIDEIRFLGEAGYSAVKVKVGRLEAKTEALRVREFRDVLDPSVELIVDANGVWPDLATAKPIVRMLEDVGVTTVEDPFPAARLKDSADLRRCSHVQISAGELYGSPQQFYTAFDVDAIDIPQVDATVCGGITAFLAIAKFYESKKMRFETHWFPELHVHLAQLSSAASRIEIFAHDKTINFGQLISSRNQVLASGALPSLDCGHGIQLLNTTLFS
jgi:L-alanine-DL-glutamate epimerase-like enolase superfamily enzyme